MKMPLASNFIISDRYQKKISGLLELHIMIMHGQSSPQSAYDSDGNLTKLPYSRGLILADLGRYHLWIMS